MELGDVGLTASSRLCASLVCVENHEADVGLDEDMLDEVKGDATEAVAVGNHNLFDAAAHRAVQNGEQAPALEVDAGRNIRNDLVLGIETYEVLALEDEVGLLLFGRDAGVDDAGFGSLLFLAAGRDVADAKVIGHVLGVVEAAAAGAEAGDADLALFCEGAEGVVADTEGGSDLARGQVALLVGGLCFFIQLHKCQLWQTAE